METTNLWKWWKDGINTLGDMFIQPYLLWREKNKAETNHECDTKLWTAEYAGFEKHANKKKIVEVRAICFHKGIKKDGIIL